MTPRSSRRKRSWLSGPAVLSALIGWLLLASDLTTRLAVGGEPAALPSFDRSVKAVFEARCYECHDAQNKEGNLDLTAIATDYADPTAFAIWVRIHDRVRDGEMPPAGAQRLTADEQAGLLHFLDEKLRTADAVRQAREGRALARRLNREEYQHTLHDLLGIEEDYRGLLPDDGSASGFDKVGSALSISPEHLEAYLAAAEAALGEAIVTDPAPPVTRRKIPQRLSGFTVTSFRNRFAHMFVDEPDAIVRFTDFVDGVLGFRAQATGNFRFRIRAYAWHTDKPVRARIRAGYPGDNAGGTRWLVGYEQFPPEGDTVEVTVRLHPGETLRVGPYAVGSKEARFRDVPGRFAYRGPALAIEWVEVEGPLYDAWPPAGHQRLFGTLDFSTATRTDAQRVLRDFLPRAFRRPVIDDEVQHYLALYDQAATERGFQSGIKTALKAALCSPHFLFLHAPPGVLDDHALAARLSYFLWNSMPDDELSAAATRGELCQPAMLRRQVERMLGDPKTAAFTESFTGQWLDLRKIAATSPDATLYPEFDEFLQYSMVEETRRFFDELLQHDLSVTNFVQSDFAMLNDRLATLYGIAGVEGVKLRKVALPAGSVRGGVLTQASVLKVTANGTVTSPVLRGAWLMDRILDKPVPPPPPSVTAIEPDIRGATTIRQQLSQHRDDQSCAVCHSKMDPAGFALESFDVIGGWRERYRAERETAPERMLVQVPERLQTIAVGVGRKVDASGMLPDGRAFRDFNEFRRLLLADEDQLSRALAAKLLIYATGSGLRYADRAAVEQIVVKLRAEHRGFRALVHEIVQSPVFLRQ